MKFEYSVSHYSSDIDEYALCCPKLGTIKKQLIVTIAFKTLFFLPTKYILIYYEEGTKATGIRIVINNKDFFRHIIRERKKRNSNEKTK